MNGENSLNRIEILKLKLNLPKFPSRYNLGVDLLSDRYLKELSGYDYLILLYFSTLKDDEQVRIFHIQEGIDNVISEKALRSSLDRLSKLEIIEITGINWNNVKYYGRVQNDSEGEFLPVSKELLSVYKNKLIKAHDIKVYITFQHRIILKKEEYTQNELAIILGTSQSVVSKSISRLLSAGLLKID